MSSIIYFLIGTVLGAISVWLYMSRKIKDSEREIGRMEREKEEQEEEYSGLDGFNKKRQKKIEGRKDKIVDMIKEKGSVQTSEVSDMFDISRNTAYRYLEELEEENKIEQTKESGRSVRYRLYE